MLWGISWNNVRLMLDDSARSVKNNNTEGTESKGEVIHRELKTKEDIKNYVKGIL